jgi:predicted ATPase
MIAAICRRLDGILLALELAAARAAPARTRSSRHAPRRSFPDLNRRPVHRLAAAPDAAGDA